MAEKATKGEREQTQERKAQAKGRSLPEWISFVLSLLIVLGSLALVVLEIFGPDGPPQIEIEAKLDEAYRVGEAFHVPVEVVNSGGQTAEDLIVKLELKQGDEAIAESELQFRFLGQGGREKGVAVFDQDPRRFTLEARVTSYLSP